MEVFIAYTQNDSFLSLKQTVEAWEKCDGAEVALVEVKDGEKFEVHRRVICDNAAKGKFYIMADVGCVPADEGCIVKINHELNEDCGLYGFGKHKIPTGVRAVQRGVVKKWPAPAADYDSIHAEAVRKAGKQVSTWPDISYKRVRVF